MTSKATLATLITAIVALATLAFAYTAQYGFGLLPCDLCFAQRPLYFAAGLFALMALLPAVDVPERRLVVMLCAALFAAEAGIALYHAGVEYKWWLGPSACTMRGGRVSMQDLSTALSAPAGPMCDQPTIMFANISMAGLNFIAAAVFAVGAAFASTRQTWWSR